MLTKTDLLKLVRDYYDGAEMLVSSLPRRELAFLTWDNRMIRHQAFNNEKDLQDAVVRKAPKAVYASLSKYLDPSHRPPKEVDRKNIDCQECNLSYSHSKQIAPCPRCGVQNEKATINTKDRRAMDLAFDIDYGDIPGADLRSPKENLGAAARSTLNLVKILVEDLGFEQSDMNITFSGKKGFHVRVANNHPLFSDNAQKDESVRKALVSYVSGYDFKMLDFIKVQAHLHSANTWHLKAYESGWGYRFNQSVEYLLKAAKGSTEDFDRILDIYSPWYDDKKRKGQKKNLPSQKVIEGFRKACNEHRESILKGGDIRQMKDAEAKRLLLFALYRTRLRYASFVDRRVTADKARILRIPGSLHGGSGLVCCKVPTLEHLTDMSWVLDLQKELLGDEEVEVSISKTAHTYYGVYEPGEHKVSKHIAYALLCSQ